MMNIIGTNEIIDPFYRYKRPKFIISVTGKGNKQRTSLINMDDICVAIDRSLSEVIKYYCYELGTSYKLVEGRHTLKGEFNIDTLDNVLHKYIQIFVLCKDCDLPSTFYKVRKTNIKKVCSACGCVEKLYPDHKLVEYILKEKKNRKTDFNVNCQDYS